MKIAVIGSGKLGGTLGGKWAEAGHDVVFGVREPERKRAERSAENPDIPFESPHEAIVGSQVVVFAVPASAMAGIVETHADDLKGKILVDGTNDFGSAGMSHVDKLLTSAPGAKVFRAFNSLGWENFADPTFGGERADLFYCGSEDTQASKVVEVLIQDVGLRPSRVGDLEQVSIVDSVLTLWFTLAVGRGLGRHMAFKVIRD